MRYLAFLLVAACELQPAPKQAPPSEQPTTPTAPTPPPVAAADAGVDALVVPQECIAAGVRVAEILIQDAQDPTQKQALQQDQAKIVQRTSQTCAQNSWSTEVISCIRGAKTTADLQNCEKLMPHAAPAPTPEAAGSAGSAAPVDPATGKRPEPGAVAPAGKGSAAEPKADAKATKAPKADPKATEPKATEKKTSKKTKKAGAGSGSAAPQK